MTQIQTILAWIRDAGHCDGTFRPEYAATYLRLVLEECEEAIEAADLQGDPRIVHDWLRDQPAEASFIMRTGANRAELLDAAIDLIWVSVGLAASLGADVEGALGEVIRSNDSKRADGRLTLDATGKVMKGPNYSPPNLLPYLTG